jgi:hypothetical protein
MTPVAGHDLVPASLGLGEELLVFAELGVDLFSVVVVIRQSGVDLRRRRKTTL